MFTDVPYERLNFAEWWDMLTPTFISFYFIAFVFLIVLLYYLLPQKARWCVLLAGSAVFYSLAGLHPFITILLSSYIVYCAGVIIDRAQNQKKKRLILAIAITALLGELIYTKYYTARNLNLGYVIPLGISYYTLSALGYLIDVYKAREPAEHNFFRMVLFLLFFPTILQGPISKHRILAPQLNEGHNFDWRNFCFGMQLSVWGYFKKMVIADRIAIFTTSVFSSYNYIGGGILLLSFILYTLQLYCDFSGCMDIAGGIAQMLGIQLENNFDHPFCSKNVAEFWRRWHITLGTWFKDYVYIPLGGNRLGIKRKCFNTMIIFLLSGLWHGNGVIYIVWGIYWGILSVGSIIFCDMFKYINNKLHINISSTYWHTIQIIRTFLLFVVGWIIAIPGDLKVSWNIIKKIFTDWQFWQFTDGTLYTQGLDWKEFVLMWLMLGLLWMISTWQKKGSIRYRIANWNIVVRCAVYAGAVISILVFGIYGIGYDTSSFIYMQF